MLLTKKNKVMERGCTDIPAEIDQFKISKYITGLADFLCMCDTPMTVAIQGDWGTGKTSIMNLVVKELKDNKIKDENLIWFNTWQFSQFDLGSQLPMLLLSKLILSIGGKDRESQIQGIKSVMAGIVNLTSGILTQDSSDGSKLTDTLFNTNFTESYAKLAQSFRTLVDSKVPDDDGRIIIFVDDLDRLSPGRAIELLEVMKNFFDCPKCVFVLAIDYGVVLRGVKEKYGQDFDDEKGKSFFDKIIQVPFRVPVASYDIKGYVRDNFKRIGVHIDDEKILSLYVELIENSIGNNPRSMKRLFNSFLLLRKVAGDELISDIHQEQILFSLLCMQSKFPSVYDYLIRIDKQELTEELLMAFVNADSKIIELFKMNEDKSRMFCNFASYFYEVVDTDNTKKIDKDELNVLHTVLGFSSITSTGLGEQPVSRGSRLSDIDGLEMQYKTREEKEELVEFLKSSIPELSQNIYFVVQNSGGGYIDVRIDSEKGKEVAFIIDRSIGIRLGGVVSDIKYIDDDYEGIIKELKSKENNWFKSVSTNNNKEILVTVYKEYYEQSRPLLSKLLRYCFNSFKNN